MSYFKVNLSNFLVQDFLKESISYKMYDTGLLLNWRNFTASSVERYGKKKQKRAPYDLIQRSDVSLNTLGDQEFRIRWVPKVEGSKQNISYSLRS